jgi:glycosidase
MGVDALRIDTVKHVPRDNLLEYVNAWKAHKPGLFVFGENLVKGYRLGRSRRRRQRSILHPPLVVHPAGP